MTQEELTAYLNKNYPGAELKQGSQFIEMNVANTELHAIALRLKESEETAFDYLVSMTGVDYPEYMTVVYHLESTKHRHFIVLKSNTVNREDPVIDTVSDIWPTSEFLEREVFDLLGVKFNNHPDLRRLFLDDNWGYPLRKDYIDDVHIVSR
jgi:NADH:ubiquinone oxidoreductase subunit C